MLSGITFRALKAKEILKVVEMKANMNHTFVICAYKESPFLEECVKSLLAQSERSVIKLATSTPNDYGEIKCGSKETSTTLLKIKRLLLLPIHPKCMQHKKWIQRGIISFGNSICCPSVTYVKENLPEKLFATHFRSNVDWETWERLSKLDGSFVYCKHVLMFHRIHEGSETSSVINENKRGQEDYEMFQKFWPRFIAKMLTKKYASSEKYNNG